MEKEGAVNSVKACQVFRQIRAGNYLLDLTTRPSLLTLTRAGSAELRKENLGFRRLQSKKKQKQGDNALSGDVWLCRG